MLQVVEFNSLESLESLRVSWNSLLLETQNASFFQTLDWLQNFWKHYGQENELRVLAVYDNRSPLGIVPLALFRERTRIGTVRVLTYPLRDWATFYGPIGPNPAATLNTSMKHLAQRERDWDLFDLRHIDSQIDHGRTAMAMNRAGFQAWEGVWTTTTLLDFKNTYEAYLKSRTSKFRNNLRRAEKRAAQHGQLLLERFRPAKVSGAAINPRWDLFDESVALSRKSWQAASESGTTLSHDAVMDFYRDTHQIAVHSGTLDLNLLRIDELPIAFAYNYHYEGRVYGSRMGFDPAYAQLSPGTLLLARTIEDSFQRRDRLLDLGIDYLKCKRFWRTRTADSFRCSHYPVASVQAQVLRCKRWLKEQLDEFQAA